MEQLTFNFEGIMPEIIDHAIWSTCPSCNQEFEFVVELKRIDDFTYRLAREISRKGEHLDCCSVVTIEGSTYGPQIGEIGTLSYAEGPPPHHKGELVCKV